MDGWIGIGSPGGRGYRAPYSANNQISTTKVLKDTRNADLQHFTTKVRMLIMAGLLYSISQEMHFKQNAGGNFHISSFNGRVMHFQVLRYIIIGEKSITT